MLPARDASPRLAQQRSKELCDLILVPITTNAIPGTDRNAMSSKLHPAKRTLASPLTAFCTSSNNTRRITTQRQWWRGSCPSCPSIRHYSFLDPVARAFEDSWLRHGMRSLQRVYGSLTIITDFGCSEISLNDPYCPGHPKAGTFFFCSSKEVSPPKAYRGQAAWWRPCSE